MKKLLKCPHDSIYVVDKGKKKWLTEEEFEDHRGRRDRDDDDQDDDRDRDRDRDDGRRSSSSSARDSRTGKFGKKQKKGWSPL